MTVAQRSETLKPQMAGLAQLQIALLTHADHIAALPETPFSQDANTRRIFDQQLAIAAARSQGKRDGLQSLLDSMPTPAQSRANLKS
jgi:hypothetical protein